MDRDKVIIDNKDKEESRYFILFLDDIFPFAKMKGGKKMNIADSRTCKIG